MSSQSQCAQMEWSQTAKVAGSNPSANVQQPGELIFSVDLDGRLPSWNDLLGMEHWARHKLKQELQETFLSALRRSDPTSLTKITYAKNTTSTYAATLELFMETARLRRELKLLKKKLGLVKESSSGPKSSNSKRKKKTQVPF